MVKVDELLEEIKSVEKQYAKAVEKENSRAMYMLQRRLIRLRKDLNTFKQIKKEKKV